PIMLCPADEPDPANFHSYLVNHHLPEHGMTYSSTPPMGLTPSDVIVMGEKKSASTNYYVEILNGSTTYYEQVEEYRHGRSVGSNYLFQDLHVAAQKPGKVLPGAQDPWDFP